MPLVYLISFLFTSLTTYGLQARRDNVQLEQEVETEGVTPAAVPANKVCAGTHSCAVCITHYLQDCGSNKGQVQEVETEGEAAATTDGGHGQRANEVRMFLVF